MAENQPVSGVDTAMRRARSRECETRWLRQMLLSRLATLEKRARAFAMHPTMSASFEGAAEAVRSVPASLPAGDA